jgi:hypothetical protein
MPVAGAAPVLTRQGPRGTVICRFGDLPMLSGIRMVRFAAVAAALWVAASPANAASFLEKNFWLSGPNYSGDLPACDNGWALGEIQRKFSSKEGRFWNSSLSSTDFERVQETAYSPWANQTIPRRFCSAVALVSDGVRRPIHYSISEDLGEIGAVWGVEWCVVGLDRNWAYNPACRVAKP